MDKSFLSVNYFNFRLFAFASSALAIVLISVFSWQNGLPKIAPQFQTAKVAVLNQGLTEQVVRQDKPQAPHFQNSATLQTAPSAGMATDETIQGSNELMRAAPVADGFVSEKKSIPPALTPNSTIKDSREFLELNYGAYLSSLDVNKTAVQVQGVANNLHGRLDNVSVNQDSAAISFVVPKTNIEALKIQLKNLVGEKFYIETISASNLLPQKQQIEQNTQTTQEQLADLKKQLADLVKSHQITVAGLNSQITSVNNQLAQIENDLKINPLNPDAQNKKQQLTSSLAYLKWELNQENLNFQDSSDYLNDQISMFQNKLKDLSNQDQNLLDQVETVSANVQLVKINWLEYVNAYLPFYISLPSLFVLFIVYFFFWRKNKIVLP